MIVSDFTGKRYDLVIGIIEHSNWCDTAASVWFQPSDENLITGVHLYAESCAICHGASDAKPSNPAQGFYIETPQLAKDGVEDDREAASFWKVKHGIRFTARPSFAVKLQDKEIWKIAMFLKQMDKLPPTVDAECKKVANLANQ
jgi:thiosulfate dehydrogenase